MEFMKNDYTISLFTTSDGDIDYEVYIGEHIDSESAPEGEGGICTGTLEDALGMLAELVIEIDNR